METAVREFRPDLILSDFSMPTDLDGFSALAIAREHTPDVPFIFVSGTIGEDRAVDAVKSGATDYVLKDKLERLGPVVTRALQEARDRRAPVTGLGNRDLLARAERYLFYESEMNARVAEKLSLESKLRRALDREQFELHYQSKVNLKTGAVEGLEALIRWNDPDSGLVLPMKFIPLLEETGLILDVGRTGLDAHGLDIELTESVLMQEIEATIPKLHALKEMGVRISIDDFGTGYSSLSYLAQLPVDALKVDRSFIMTMEEKPESMTIVSTVISLAHTLRLTVIAEGVEHQEQAKLLRLLDCDEAQGYLFSKPVPWDQHFA
jgi:EAL domain-containing protein (putative c-di-GMP-specific phosphodiesterase class I)